MKKSVSIILSFVLLVSVCSFVVYANDDSLNKISEYDGIFSDSSDSDIIDTGVYLNNNALSVEERGQLVYDKCGLSKKDNYGFELPYFYLSDEDKELWKEADALYNNTERQVLKELGLAAAQPVFEYIDITPVENGGDYYYKNNRIILGEKFIRLYLSKAEIIKLAEMDYVTGIICYNPNYQEPSETDQSFTQEPTADPYNPTAPNTDPALYREEMYDSLNGYNVYSNISGSEIIIEFYFSEMASCHDRKAYAEELVKKYGISEILDTPVPQSGYDSFVCTGKLKVSGKQNAIEVCGKLFDDPSVFVAYPIELTTPPLVYELGDVNGDGITDVLDATVIQKYAVLKITFCAEQKDFGDYNKDGFCDVVDATEIQKFAVKKNN